VGPGLTSRRVSRDAEKNLRDRSRPRHVCGAKPKTSRRSHTAYRLLLLAGVLAAVRPAHALGGDLVFTETNDTQRNELVVLQARGGAFHPLWRVATRGRGSGAGLGSQGAVTLSDDGLWLVAVNAGSNEVSLFSVGSSGRPIPARRGAVGEHAADQ